jgi:hypothetical protein
VIKQATAVRRERRWATAGEKTQPETGSLHPVYQWKVYGGSEVLNASRNAGHVGVPGSALLLREI